MTKLTRSFFNRPTVTVAQELLGKELFFHGRKGIITETEAYVGWDDPACHAARGKTRRTAVLFGQPGYSYVYLIYGMYNCLNFVTENEGLAGAVLIRAVTVDDVPAKETNGPGKLCRFLGITREHNAIDIVNSTDFYVSDGGIALPFETTSRIGISCGQDKLWRFVVKS